MNLRRILQLALTSFVGQGISIITQLLIPPFFLRFYPTGIEVYGEGSRSAPRSTTWAR